MSDFIARRRLALARRVVGGLAVALLLAAVVIFSTGQITALLGDLGSSGAALLAAINCALAAWSASGRLRTAWGSLAGACLAWWVGQSVFTFYDLVAHAEVPFPGLASFAFLWFPIGAVIAITVFPTQASQADRRRMTLDGLMAAAAIGLISWGTALGAVVAAGGSSPFATALSVAYPLADIVLMVLCILVLSRSQTHRAPLGAIGAGLALMAAGDSGFAYLIATGAYYTGNPIDLFFYFAFALLALAPLAPGATRVDAPAGTPIVAGVLLPYVPLAGVVAFVGWQFATGHRLSEVEGVLIGVVVMLVLARQALTVRDNQRLAVALAAGQAELEHQAFHDRLTGLANRALFVDRLAHALELHRRDGRALAVCFIDLDGFKAVNDTLGHNAGDALLQGVSARFGAALSGADTLARFGGDEFAVLLEDQSGPEAVGWALLECLRQPFDLGASDGSVLASIGVAQVGPDDETPSVEDLLARADRAMYVVKRRGKAGVLRYTEELEADGVDRVLLGRALAEALADKQVTVAFQPIVDVGTGRLDTLEALARWAPDGHPVSPEVFVPVAEECQLLDALFESVLDESCERLARWTSLPGCAEVRVAVNVSPSQLSSPDLPRLVEEVLARHGLDGRRLVLEITEAGPLGDRAVGLCHELRLLGVRLAVDGFGTGMSTLSRLRDLPIDEVKIDRSFIAGIDHDDARHRFVAGVLALASHIGLTVVAEGVEREAERATLTVLGCHRAQGYLFSHPVPGDAVARLLASSNRWLGEVPTTRAPVAEPSPGLPRR